MGQNIVMLTRTETSDVGTFGKIITPSGFTCVTGELPWRENQPNRSCIPVGSYAVMWGPSEKFGNSYHVIGVPNRTNIEIHSGNFVGDTSMGYRSDILGCIILGLNLDVLFGQRAVVSSREALLEFVQEMNQQDFELIIQN